MAAFFTGVFGREGATAHSGIQGFLPLITAEQQQWERREKGKFAAKRQVF